LSPVHARSRSSWFPPTENFHSGLLPESNSRNFSALPENRFADAAIGIFHSREKSPDFDDNALAFFRRI